MAPDIPLSFADTASPDTISLNTPSGTSPRLTIHGNAEIGFERRDGATRLVRLFHHDPLRVLFPNPRTGDVALATLVTTSGGLVGGDRLDIAVSLGADARAMVTTQAAEKVYRSNGPDVVVSTELKAGDGAWMEWLPQEAILFDGARLRRTTALDIAGEGRAMAGELLVFGRTAHGERFTYGLARDAWEVRRDGRLIWADALHLDGDIAAILDHPACFGGATAYGTILYAAPDADRHLDFARSLLEAVTPGIRAAATCFDGLLVIRWIGVPAHHLRRDYARFWSAFRSHAAGLPARLPRLWDV
jgi:urease accessory protein